MVRSQKKQPLFLSHDHRDQPLARALAGALNRITLGQLEVWFSSDLSPDGGIQPGRVWLDEIRTRLRRSKAILVLLTKRSVSRPWLLFESGFGAGMTGHEIIPICIGVNPGRDVPFPLGMYQSFQLADYESLKGFAVKLLKAYGIAFDEEMVAPILRKAVSELVKESVADDAAADTERPLTMDELAETIKQHLDRRIVQLLATAQERGSGRKTRKDAKDRRYYKEAKDRRSYSVPIVLRFPGLEKTQYIEIDSSTTLQEVLDNIYYMLEDRMPAFAYLSRWILRETRTGMRLVVREIGEMIPAIAVFTPTASWEAVPIDRPYTAADSTDTSRWYGRKP